MKACSFFFENKKAPLSAKKAGHALCRSGLNASSNGNRAAEPRGVNARWRGACRGLCQNGFLLSECRSNRLDASGRAGLCGRMRLLCAGV